MSRKQPVLPDESFEPPAAIAEIEDLAEEYAAYRDQRMEIGREEKARKTRLIAVKEKHNLTEYNRDGIEIRFETEKKLKVKVKDHSTGETDSTDTADSPDTETATE